MKIFYQKFLGFNLWFHILLLPGKEMISLRFLFSTCVFFVNLVAASRDYFAEIEAAIPSKLPSWQIQHLSLWTDYIEPPATTVVIPDTEDIVAMEDQAQAAKFREIKAKISQDCASMSRFNAQVTAQNKRLHVVTVMHEKGQNSIGRESLVFPKQFTLFFTFTTVAVFYFPKRVFLLAERALARSYRLCENHMEKFHKILNITDYKNLVNLDPAYRLVASSHKVGTGNPPI